MVHEVYTYILLGNIFLRKPNSWINGSNIREISNEFCKVMRETYGKECYIPIYRDAITHAVQENLNIFEFCGDCSDLVKMVSNCNIYDFVKYSCNTRLPKSIKKEVVLTFDSLETIKILRDHDSMPKGL